ncbi:hypothetical protein BH23CHL8_BH23CHL8_26480 [soil metagenome]
MLQLLRQMPTGVVVFLAYGFLILAVLGLTMPLVVAQAVEAPISFVGLVWMLLLAYLIFTLTLVLQRKQAAYGLALGLATLSLPLVPVMYLSPAGLAGAAAALAVFALVLWSLRRPRSRAWFVEP